MVERYSKYDGGVPIHWNWYESNEHRYRELVDLAIAPFIGRKGSIVDIGSGDGLVDSLLIEMGFDVLGVEPEEQGTLIANRKVPQMRVLEMSVEKYVQETISHEVDFLFSLNTIEHVAYPKYFVGAMKFVKEFAIIITDDATKNVDKDPMHQREFTYGDLSALFVDFVTEPVDLRDLPFIGIKVYANKA